MTETERMKQGYIWEDDDENIALQAKCKTLVRKFNELPPEAMEEREALLHDIFGEVGEHVWFNSPLTVTVGKYVSIGSGTYANINHHWQKCTDRSKRYVMHHRTSDSSITPYGRYVLLPDHHRG